MLLTNLVQFLTQFFATGNYPPDEQGGIFRPSDTDLTNDVIRRIGLALEPTPGLTKRVLDNGIDVLWLHRPWHLDQNALPGNLPVLYHHLPFDEHLTVGYNQWLADVLGLTEPVQPLGFKQAPGHQARPIGMIGRGRELSFGDWCHQITNQFGGYDEAIAGQKEAVRVVAIVGAMTDVLVREAADRGASLYITGQNRKPAQQALEETGMSLLAIGHRRSEVWGLRMLADVLTEQTSLTVVLL